MGDYSISVVTPYHNVDNDMFDRCCKSMLDQTIGFENVEWIIVVHNSDEDHNAYVKQKLGKYKNVIIKEVKNACRTPSSPRNEGLDLVTSDYVAFLDGDDKFREYALEKIIYYFEKSQCNILAFRREFELENVGLVAISETVTWDTTREMIIVDMNDHVDNRNYNSFPFFVTNRAFKREFLDDNNIRFDEEIDNAEDCYFNLQTIHLADKICFLPQFIGYTYFINTKSILSSEKSDEEILHMLRNSQKIIEDALDYGLYVNLIILSLGFVMSRYLTSPTVKMETRNIIKETFEPYLRMTSPVPAGRFMEPIRTMMNILPFEIIINTKRFEKKNVVQNGFEVLAGILKENEKTHFGKRYHFEDILSIRGYQSQVPISGAKMYQPMVDAEKSIGDINIYSSKKPGWYVKLLNGMYLPVSEKQAQGYADVLKNVLKGKNILICSNADNPVVVFNNGVIGSTISGITLDCYLSKYRFSLSELSRNFVIPKEIYYQMNDKADDTAGYNLSRQYLLTLMSVADRDVDQIIIFGFMDYQDFINGLNDNLLEIADDIEAGYIHRDLGLHESVNRFLDLRFRPNPKRAAELREIYKKEGGFKVTDIWKNLSDITLIEVLPTTVSQEEFDGIKINKPIIVCEAGIIGLASGEKDQFILNRENIFYEFMIEKQGQKQLILCDELKEGDIVRPVITNDAGLYRFPLSFKIEILDFREGNIIFRVNNNGSVG